MLAADIKMRPIKTPENLLPRGGYPQREPPFDKLVLLEQASPPGPVRLDPEPPTLLQGQS